MLIEWIARGSRPTGSEVRNRDWLTPARFAAALGPIVLLGVSAAQEVPPVFIQGTTLIDGTGQEPRAGVDILLQAGRVSAVGPAGTVRAPAEAMLVDASGKFVVPGMVNLRGLAGLVRSPAEPPDHFIPSVIARHLATYASYGVTTAATLAPDGGTVASVRTGTGSGSPPRQARALSPLRAIGRLLPPGMTSTQMQPLFETIRGRRAALSAVDRLAADGADFIELWVGHGPPDAGELRDARAVIRRASRRNLRVSVVTSKLAAALAGVQAGARLLAASITDTEVGQDFVEAMKDTGTVYAPALFAETARFSYEDRPEWLGDRYLRRSLLPGISGHLRGPVQVAQALDPDHALKQERFRMALRNLRKLAQSGVAIGFASGSGFPNTFEGYSDYRECFLMKRAGLTALEVIRAFSAGSAAALGMASDIGAVQAGGYADLVILNADPRDNIHNLRDLHAVFVGGVLVPL
ncbi:MAG: amidohydrolase family protein [Bryobacterales bacterium]|nr:amidohydrolase family protein [Bryobacterales bacterium]